MRHKEQDTQEPLGGRCSLRYVHDPLPFTRLFPDHAIDVSDGTFKREVLDFSGPVLLEFFAPW